MITTISLFQSEGADERSLEFLTNAIEKNNLPGFDYFEFKRAVATMATMNIDEATAFKSAFATAGTLGFTKEKLLETAAYYRDLVEKEKDRFNEALDKQNTAKVSSRQEEIKRLRDQIDRHKAEISRLQDEIGKYLTEAELAEKSVALETEKLEKAHKAFEKTHQGLLRNIDKDIENIQKYI
ncbi:MAG: hypothetical protein IPL65_17330 [Lewinellaceae bacterium]|nr:hypothetical protein [Lewinellaceae bacterium]